MVAYRCKWQRTLWGTHNVPVLIKQCLAYQEVIQKIYDCYFLVILAYHGRNDEIFIRKHGTESQSFFLPVDIFSPYRCVEMSCFFGTNYSIDRKNWRKNHANENNTSTVIKQVSKVRHHWSTRECEHRWQAHLKKLSSLAFLVITW